MSFTNIDHSSATPVEVSLSSEVLERLRPTAEAIAYDDTTLKSHIELLRLEISQLKDLQASVKEDPKPVLPDFDYDWLSREISDVKGVFGDFKQEREAYLIAYKDSLTQVCKTLSDRVPIVNFDPQNYRHAAVSAYLSTAALVTISVIVMLQYLHI